ncbi:MAG: hypothetical protein H0W76_10250 [Pyrinomonadaceae bacterium]|nr:hypothetical protein [Pyrinomonadaceae bacterium]
MRSMIKLPEPTLLFGHDQAMEDPRDGLTLFKPLDEGKIYGIRAGVIGTKEGIRRYKDWVERIQKPIFDLNDVGDPLIHRPFFPGFETVFGIPWESQPTLEIQLPEGELEKHLFLDDKYQRVYKTVEVYSERIIQAIRQEDAEVDIWFVVIPENVWKKCRPKSFVEAALRIKSADKMPVKRAQTLQIAPSLFNEENLAAIPYHYEVNFHIQLKARLLEHKVLTQILRETTIAPHEFKDQFGRLLRQVDEPSAIAWNLSTAVFYKAGGRPWKISDVREGVCYIGLVFKQDERNPDPRSACCAAQMFLDSGDGVVFKGAVGPWHVPGRGDYHLTRVAAKQLVGLAVDTYKYYKKEPPKELFLHGKVRFEHEEWNGFRDAMDSSTNLVGVRIHDESYLRLYRRGRHPVLRGLAHVRDTRTAYLWTKGYIPRLQTYPGRGVPKPLLIDVCRGKAPIETVLGDIMALTKLNYNTCIFADGQPVTLKFADAVGEILTAGPIKDVTPLPFKHYI